MSVRNWIGAALLTAAVATPAAAADRQRYTGEGEAFDFGIETEGGKATLYVARKPTNEPHAGDKPRLVPDDEGQAPLVFEPTEDPGVYVLSFGDGKLPEGQIEVTIAGTTEAADAYAVESGHDDHSGHDHAHGAARRSVSEMVQGWPVAAAGAFGLFLVGLIAGRALGRRRASEPGSADRVVVSAEGEAAKRVSAVLLALAGAAAFGWPTRGVADEGHTHDTVEIRTGASAAGEVAISKKSQFLIGLRTQPAAVSTVRDTVETFGHVGAKPQLDAAVRAPSAGVLRVASVRLLGAKVRKGQVLGRVEGLGAPVLIAPLTGTVLEASAVDGARVEAGETLFRIVDTSKVWLDAEVFQKDLGRVRGISVASIRLEGAAETLQGKVLGLTSTIDESTLTAKVFVELDNADGSIPLGALGTVSFALDATRGEGMVLPKGAVLNRGGERIVFVQTGVESFVAKPVVTRFGADPGSVVVTKGLDAGDRVVVSGGYQLLVGAN